MIFIKTLKKTIQIKNLRKKFKKNCSKKLNPVVTELFIRDRKLNIFFCFYYTISLCYYNAPKNIRLNSTQDIFMKIPNKQKQ